MKKLIWGAALVVCLSFPNPVLAEKSFREDLADSENVLRLLQIDEYHTYLVPKVFARFYPELAALTMARGGQPEMKVRKVDPFTGQETISWVPVKMDAEGKFVHPITGAKEAFSYGDPAMPLTAFTAELRFRGVFALGERWLGDGGVTGIETKQLKALLLKHEDPQPFLYKSPDLPPPARLLAPHGTGGEVDATFWTFTEHGEAKRGGLAKLLNLTPEGIDPQEHLVAYQTLCRTQGGVPSYAVRAWDRSSGNYQKPVAAGALEAFLGIRDSHVLLGCEGPAPFLVKFGNGILFGPGRRLAELASGKPSMVSQSVSTEVSAPVGSATFPEGFEDFIRLTARVAQKHGRFESSAFGYTLKGEALREATACRVQIEVFQGDLRLDRREVDGCQ